jgi:hypothetical protein
VISEGNKVISRKGLKLQYLSWIYLYPYQIVEHARYNDIAAKKSVLYQVFEDPAANQFSLKKKLPQGQSKRSSRGIYHKKSMRYIAHHQTSKWLRR